MGLPRRARPDPDRPQSIVDQLDEVLRVLAGYIEFGSPQDPRDPASTTRATGTAATHNGTIQNIRGSWVENDAVDALDTKFDFAHNLEIPVVTVGGVIQPNVRVVSFLVQHNGTGVNAASTLSFNYDTRDAGSITANSFPLRFYAGGTRTVNGANPLRVSLFFIPGTR